MSVGLDQLTGPSPGKLGWPDIDPKWIGRSWPNRSFFSFLGQVESDPCSWVGPKLAQPNVHYTDSGREL